MLVILHIVDISHLWPLNPWFSLSFILHLWRVIQVLPKLMNRSNIHFLGMVWNRTFAPLWSNVILVNAMGERLENLVAHSNCFHFHLLFGWIFVWISLLAYPNQQIHHSSFFSCLIRKESDLETYLRCFSSNKQRWWVQRLPLAKCWYNTSYHTSSRMTPLEAVHR